MPADRLTAIVLAAGTATRFGGSKQLAEIGGETLIRRAVNAAETVCGARSVLIVGDDWQRVHAAAAPLAGFLVRNDAYRSGMASSIRAAVGALRGSSDAVLLTLCDQPLVGAPELARLIDAWRAAPTSIACSVFDGAMGPPAIFPARFFDELAALEGDTGARPVLERHSDAVIKVSCEAAGTDVDEIGDLERLRDQAP